MELGPEDVSLLERYPHFRGWYTSNLNVGMDMRGKLTGPSKPMPLILDDEGRVVDTSGRTIQPMMRQPTIKVSTI